MEGKTTDFRFSIFDFRLPLGLFVLSILLMGSPVFAAATKPEPSFLRGVGKVIAGVVLELPKTVVDATMTGPPVIGTAVGLLAGTSRAIQTTVGGLVEMAAGFDPWRIKQAKRTKQ